MYQKFTYASRPSFFRREKSAAKRDANPYGYLACITKNRVKAKKLAEGAQNRGLGGGRSFVAIIVSVYRDK